MSAVVRTLVRDHAKQLVVPSIQKTPESQFLRKRDFREVFRRTTPWIIDGSGEVDDENFGKFGDLNRTSNPSLWC